MQPPIALVVFDIAGTTVHDDGAIALAFQQAMQAWGYFIPLHEINPLMGYKKPEAIRKMLVQYEQNEDRITQGLVEKIHQRFLSLMIAHYRLAPLQALPGAVTVFKALKSRGIRVALNTGFSRDITDVILERLGWLRNGLVDDVIASSEVPAGRPHPYMTAELMRRAGIGSPDRVVKVGDTEVDVHEGFNAGCRYSIAVTTGAFTREALMPHSPSFIIDSLEELLPILEPAPIAA
jgi:phosphonatase-like hydrolase